MRGIANDSMDLVAAAARLRKSYNATLRLVLLGKLEGARVAGRWKVRAADVERLARERAHATIGGKTV